LLGARDQRAHGRLVLGFHHAPVAGAGTHALLDGLGEREVVEVSGNAADHASRAAGEEQLHRRVLEERVLSGGEQFAHVAAQRRHPVRVVSIKPVREFDERLQVAFADDRRNFDRRDAQPLYPRPGNTRPRATALEDHSLTAPSLPIARRRG
jgi:hypothetical protein